MSGKAAAGHGYSLDGLREDSLIFAALNEGEAAILLSKADSLLLKPRQSLFAQGEPGDRLYVVVSGKLKVTVQTSDGKEAVLSILSSGEILGEMALLDGKPRSANVTAMEPCELLAICRDDFLSIAEARPKVLLQLMELLSSRLRATNHLLEDLRFLDLPSRLAKLLLQLLDKYGRTSSRGVWLDMRLTQEELGQLVGASRESVNKQLRLWEEIGILDFGEGRLCLLDQKGLSGLCAVK